MRRQLTGIAPGQGFNSKHITTLISKTRFYSADPGLPSGQHTTQKPNQTTAPLRFYHSLHPSFSIPRHRRFPFISLFLGHVDPSHVLEVSSPPMAFDQALLYRENMAYRSCCLLAKFSFTVRIQTVKACRFSLSQLV